MSAQPRSGLANCVGAPGGIGVEEACARAESNLGALSEQALAQIRQSLASIVSLSLHKAAPPSAPQRRELHQLACAIAGLGGMFGRDALSKAAYSFCRLIDETEPGWDKEGAAVHVRAMQLLSAPEGIPLESQEHVVDGLKKVRKHLIAHR